MWLLWWFSLSFFDKAPFAREAFVNFHATTNFNLSDYHHQGISYNLNRLIISAFFGKPLSSVHWTDYTLALDEYKRQTRVDFNPMLYSWEPFRLNPEEITCLKTNRNQLHRNDRLLKKVFYLEVISPFFQ